jgi:hypothetical protein
MCAYGAAPEHMFCKRKLQVQGSDNAQMRPVGGPNGTVPGKEVRNHPLIFAYLDTFKHESCL